MEYKKRILDSILNLKLSAFGGVLIVGPKACGKTTTAKQKAKSYIEFQDENNREQYLAVANTEPSRLLKGEKPILFDEWQDAPKIWGAVRKSIDDEQQNGLYILTGSSSQFVKTPHTGTGRISTLKMLPMSLYESEESNGKISLLDLFDSGDFEPCESNMSIDDLIFAICRGGWPRSLLIKNKEAQLEIAKDIYYQIYSRDINNIPDYSLKKSETAKKILKSYARNICTLATDKTIIGDINSSDELSRPTFKEYIETLKKLYVIEDIPAWCPSIRSKTSIRSSEKRNFIDPSIAVAALGISPSYFNHDFKTLGFLFESLCIRDLKIYSSKLHGQVSYYHDRYGLEADGVLHLSDGRYALLEFKLGQNDVDLGAKHLIRIEELIKEFNKENKQTPLALPTLKIVITGTKYAYKRNDGVFVIPIACLKD